MEKKDTIMIAFSNQKGGVSKSTMTILLASYLHYVRNLNVAVVDCDSPQHSLSHMRERDIQAVMKSNHFKQLLQQQWNRIEKKAYTIINSTPEKAWETATGFMKDSQTHFDLVIVDLPGTVSSQGVFRTIVNMDYVITPIIPDRMVMQSSLAFSTTVLDYIREKPEIPLKDIIFFWTRIKKSVDSQVFDVYNKIIAKLNLTLMKAHIPETCRYEKELPFSGTAYFRCTLLPPPAKLLKGSGLVEFADELCELLKL